MTARVGLLYLLFLLATLAAAAQRPAVAFYAGPQATAANYTIRNVKQPTTFKLGAMAGVSMKVPFENRLFFFPSFYYSLKGYDVDFNLFAFPPTELAKNNSTRIHTVEIAPLFQFDLTRNNSHPFVRFGPAIDVALSGKERFDTTIGAPPVRRAMIFSFGDYGRFTASANIHLGYESQKGWMLFAHYAHGMGSMNNADGGPKIRHRIAGISGGWIIPPKKRTRPYRKKKYF
jgi:hypothetical protein